jgi:predicted dehydrogenase
MTVITLPPRLASTNMESHMATIRLGIIMNGATGQLARGQHVASLLAIRAEGGLPVSSGDRIMPDPIFVGRNEARLKLLSAQTGITRWTTDLDQALADAGDSVFFDAAATVGRGGVLRKAIAAGKHIYAEKPIASSIEEAVSLVRMAEAAGIKHGTVQDKLFLPGFEKLLMVSRSGFLGRILEARVNMGRWVFDGSLQKGQRPSWNYQKSGGGGLVLDMFPHWRYMLDALVGPIKAVSCNMRTQIPRRIDEDGVPYDVDVEDSVFAQVEFENGAVGNIASSWATRTRQEASIMLHIDGTLGSAVATPQDCYTQAAVNTPNGRAAVEEGDPTEFLKDWLRVPRLSVPRNSYRAGWEMFIRHLIDGGDYPYTLKAGVKGVQFAELAYQSHRERRWIDVPSLD